MLEEWIQRVLKFLGAADQVIATGGPTATFVLAMLFGVAAAQTMKLLYRDFIPDPWFTLATRVVAIVASILFAHFLASSLNVGWEFAAGFSSIGFYHLTLKAVRKWAPWMEANPLVGSACPSPDAALAAEMRKSSKKDEDSGV